MTTAIILALVPAADTDAPAALLRAEGETALARLWRQMQSAGARSLHVITRPEWAKACKQALADAGHDGEVHEVGDLAHAARVVADVGATLSQPLVLAQGEIVTHTGAITGLFADPRVDSGILCGSRENYEGLGVRLERGRIASAESAYHTTSRPRRRFLGLLKVSPAHLPVLERAAHSVADTLAAPLPEPWQEELRRKQHAWAASLGNATASSLANTARLDLVSLLLVALVRSDVTLRAFYLRDLYWARPLSTDAATASDAALKTSDEEAALLRAAVKGSDGFFTTFFVSPYSRYIARWAAKRGLTPNQVTVVSLLLGLLSALAFAGGTRGWLIAGAVLLQVSFTADCVDGQLARYSRQFSGLGAWLDSIFDRSKEYAIFAGLAYGAGGGRGIWGLAIAALTLQTLRHLLDFSFATAENQKIVFKKQVPFALPWDSEVSGDRRQGDVPDMNVFRRIATLGVAASRRSESAPWMRYVKRIIVFPIGERFAVISLGAAIAGPRTVFVIFLIWSGIAAVYSGLGRVFRSVA